jgi:glycosyltransferase involved in cell wall biosynthesis
MNPVVSIIITCFNLESFIKEAIISLLEQKFDEPFELIVVNDASTDHSATVIASIKDERIIFINLPVNGGARNAVELAYKKSKGKYICRFDGDDKWPENYLKKASAVLDNNPEISMVYGDCTIIDTDGKVLSLNNNINRRDKENPILESEFKEILSNYYINAPTIMFRREAFSKAFPLPDTLTNFIDLYISLKVLQSGKAWYIDEPIAYYRLHATNMHRQMISNHLGENTFLFILDQFVVKNNQFNRREKRKIIAKIYFMLGERYFGVAAFSDAFRNYKKALLSDVKIVGRNRFLFHLLGTLIGAKVYCQIKKRLRFIFK